MKKSLLLLGLCCFLSISAYSQTCNFTFSPNAPRCPGTQIRFEADSSTDPNATYSWNFGDGGTGFGAIVNHSYGLNTSQTVYQVILTVNDSSGTCRDTLPLTVLYQPPITITAASNIDTCRFLGACDDDYNAEICLAVTGGFPGTVATYGPYSVDWGDGTTQNGNGPCFSNTFTNYGSYPAVVTANGSSCPTFAQNIRNHSIPDPPTLFIPSATYCTGDTLTAQISVPNPCPNNVDYYIIYWDYVGDRTQTDTFFSAGTIDHAYTFGNQPTLPLQPVRIRAYGVNDCYSPDDILARYNEINLNIVVSPEPNFTDNSPQCFPRNTVISFNDQSFPLAPLSPYVYSWDFGDPSSTSDTSNLRNPSYTYPGPGTYPVTLRVTDTANCGDRAIVRDVIIGEDAIAAFTTTQNTGCAPLSVGFNNTSTPPNTPDVNVRYRWEVIGGRGFLYTGGTDSTSLNPQIQFLQPGSYRVLLTVLNPFCLNDTLSTVINVQAPPTFQLNGPQDTCDLLTYQPTIANLNENGSPLITNATTPSWNFDLGANGNATPPTFVGQNPPSVTWLPTANPQNIISLTLENACGSTTVTDTFNLYSNQGITAGPDTTFCVSDTTYCLNPSPAGGVCFINGVPDSSCCVSPQLLGPGTFQVIYQLDTLGCSFFDTVNITINPLPTLGVQADSVCIGDTLTLGATPVGGTFSGNNLLFGPPVRYLGNLAGLDTLTYTYTDPITSCTANAQFTVETLPLPNVFAGSDTSYCQSGNNEALPLPNFGGGYWLNTGLADSTLGQVSTMNTGTRTITYFYTDPFGCSNTDTLDVTIIPVTPADAGPNDTLCRNALSLTLPSTGTWASNSPGFSSPNLFNPLLANTGDNLVVLTIFPGTSCEDRDTSNYVILDTALVTITTPQAIYCERDLLDTLAATPLGGSWFGLGIVDSLIGSFEPDSLTPGSNTLLTYQYLDTLSGCRSQDTIFASLNPLPTISLGPDTTYCYTAQLQALPPASPLSGTWSGIGLVLPNQFDPIASDTGQFVLTYTATNAFGCTDSASLNVMVIEPDSVSAGPDTTVCLNHDPFILPQFFPTTGGTWTGNGIQNTQTGLFSPAQAGTGNIVLVYCTGSGSCRICDTTIVSVDSPPSVLALDDSMCVDGGPISLNDNGIAFGTLTPGTWSGAGVTQTGINTFTFDTTAFGIYPIVYEHIDSIFTVGCLNRDTAFVRVDSLPIAAFPTPANACVGNLIALDNTSSGATTFQWNFGTTPPAPSTDSLPQISYLDTGLFTIELVAISPAGCDDTTSRTIFISEPPQPQFVKSLDSACAIRQIIPGINGMAVDFSDLSVPAGGIYTWDFGGGQDALGNTTSNLSSPPTIYFPQGLNDTTYYISLSIVNFCDSISYIDSVVVRPIPTAIFAPQFQTFCSPYTPTWRNNSQGSPDSYAWYIDDFGTIVSTDSLPQNISLTYNGTSDTTYRVYLVVSNSCGNDTSFQDITILPNTVDAFFSTSQTSGCAPLPVTFISYAGTSTRSFDLGDGTTSLLDTVVKVYTQPGTYLVQHFADNGCSFDTNTVSITVFPFPDLGISPRDTIICPYQDVQFQDTTGTGTSIGYVWEFGNGDSSTTTTPVYAWDSAGTYIVKVSVISTVNGCPATDSTTITVRQPPLTDFAVSDSTGCAPLTINFSNQSSGAIGYAWTFGEGSISTLNSPSFTYDSAGTYFVTLRAFDGFGCYEEAFDTLIIFPQPEAAFRFMLDDSCGGPATASFTNQSTGQIQGFRWDFNLDTSLVDNPTFTFPQVGTYPIELIASNAFGCADTARDTVEIFPQPIASWGVVPSTGCEPLEVTFNNSSTDFTNVLLDFGDQTSSTSSAASQTHLYLASSGNTTYLARLFVNYENVCFDSTSQLIEVFAAPEARFTASEDSVCGAPASIQFTDQSQDFGTIVQYLWDFGDGSANQSSLPNPSHTYQTTGNFTVRLIVTNESGCSDTSEQTIYIFPQPQATILADTTIGCYDLPITFTTQDPDFGTGWQWDFGDGNRASGKTVSHVYQFDGTFTAKVIVDHLNFCFDSATTTTIVGPPPVADFGITVTGQCDDTVIVITTNNSLFANNYQWNFGDGRTSTETEPIIAYSFPGDYDISLIAFNEFGCQDTAIVSWEYPRAIADFDITPSQQRGCAPHTVSFIDQSIGVTDWEWDFGDGTPPIFDSAATHTYLRAGSYDVTLRVSYQGLCRDTFTYPAPIEVLASPTADFSYDRVPGNEANFRFIDTSPEPGEQLFWDFGDGNTSRESNPNHIYASNPDSLWCDCEGTIPEDSAYQYRVQMIQANANGCRDTAIQWLEPRVRGLFMPNAIIPADPDELVNTFQAQAIGLCRFRLAVYNKWGNVVWEWNSENGDQFDAKGIPIGGWKGEIFGNPVDRGVFIWRIHQAEFTGCEPYLQGEGDRQGTVTVIR